MLEVSLAFLLLPIIAVFGMNILMEFKLKIIKWNVNYDHCAKSVAIYFANGIGNEENIEECFQQKKLIVIVE